MRYGETERMNSGLLVPTGRNIVELSSSMFPRERGMQKLANYISPRFQQPQLALSRIVLPGEILNVARLG